MKAVLADAVRRVRARLGSVLGVTLVQTLLELTLVLVTTMALGRIAGSPRLAAALDRQDAAGLASLLLEDPSFVAVIALATISIVLPYLVLSQALAGGLIARLASDDTLDRGAGARAFASAATQHLGGMIRLALLALVLWLPAALACVVGLAMGLHASSESFTVSQVVGGVLLRLVPGLGLTLVTATIIDQSRVALVLAGDGRVMAALKAGLKTTFTRPQALGLTVLGSLAWLAVTGLLLALMHPLDGGVALGALALFILRRLATLGRNLTRAGTLAAVVSFRKSSQA